MALSTANTGETGKLSDIQISLLRLFDQGISENETIEVRKMLMEYFNQSLHKELEAVLDQKQFAEEDYHKMLNDDDFATK